MGYLHLLLCPATLFWAQHSSNNAESQARPTMVRQQGVPLNVARKILWLKRSRCRGWEDGLAVESACFFVEDPGSVPCTRLTTIYRSSPRGFYSLFWSMWELHTCAELTCTQAKHWDEYNEYIWNKIKTVICDNLNIFIEDTEIWIWTVIILGTAKEIEPAVKRLFTKYNFGWDGFPGVFYWM